MSQHVQEKYEESQLYKILHSAAHIMAQAVLELFPEGKIAIGPPVENGFYYDFDLPRNLTPEDLESSWGLSGGHIFHGEPALDQSWIARPLLGWAQYRTPIDGLYLASAGTHPGGGLTGLSGLLAAQTVAKDIKRLKGQKA